MVIVIDGYNVSKRRWRDDGRELLSRVIAYAAYKGHQMVVVFDGGPCARQTTEKRNGVTVVYAGTQSTADEVITSMVPLKKDKELLVVTSDAHVCAAVAAHEVPTIDADVFLSVLDTSEREKKQKIPDRKDRERFVYKSGVSEQDTHKKTGHDSSGDEMADDRSALDVVMEELSVHTPVKDDDLVVVRTRTKKTLSKQEKKLMRILKKL